MKVIENGTVTNPKGYQGAGLHIGIKKKNKDFALIVSDVEAKAVGTFTTNMVKAAPVLWDKQVVENGDTVKAIAINSGIAMLVLENLVKKQMKNSQILSEML